MAESEDQRRWRRDAQILADLGSELSRGVLPEVEVRIELLTAETAVAAWERDDGDGPLDAEDFEQQVLRHRAGVLALIGLAVSERGRWEADGVYVRLSPDLIGVAVEATELGQRPARE